MRRIAFLPLLALALALPARAQGPGPMPMHGPTPGGPGGMMMPGGPGEHAAEMLLAHTGELHLSDAQVVRLAAIARRGQERREAMHARMMAEHPAQGRPRQGPPPDAEMQRMRQAMEQMHEQAHADLRDALAVLTADQQALAFEALAAHAGGPGGMHAMMAGGPRMRMRGQDGPGTPGMERRRAPAPPRDGAAPRPDQPPPQP